MRRGLPWMALLMGLMLLAAAALADSSPIYVDGTGLGDDHIINPGTYTQPPSSGTGTTTVTAAPSTGSEVVYTPVPDGYGESETIVDPDAIPKWYYDAVQLTAVWQGREAQVISLGSVVSVLQFSRDTRDTMEVYTRELTFPLSEGETRIAIIRAPKTGRISMYKKASNKSAIIMKCATCRIVPVYAVTKKYALIHYDDAVGYVSASALEMVDLDQSYGSFAYVAVNGKPLYGDTVNVRQNGAAGSRILTEFPCGQRTAVISTSEDGKWTEIEAQSLRCFILSKYLTTLPESEAAELPVKGIGSRIHANANAPAETPAPGLALHLETLAPDEIEAMHDQNP